MRKRLPLRSRLPFSPRRLNWMELLADYSDSGEEESIEPVKASTAPLPAAKPSFILPPPDWATGDEAR